MSYPDLIVKDDEFQLAAKRFDAFHKNLIEAIKQYKAIMEKVTTQAFSSGEVHAAMEAYMAYVNGLLPIVENLAGRYTTVVNNFIKDLEKADDYLYDAEISDVARDFTQSMYEKLVSCLDDPWCDLTDQWGDFWVDTFLNAARLFVGDEIKKRFNQCHRMLLDYNDETKDGLRMLFDSAHDEDKKYGGVNYALCTTALQVSRFGSFNSAMYAARDLLNEMTAVINPKNNAFNVDQIHAQLGKAYKELVNYYNETVRVSDYHKEITIPEISDFASQLWASTYFSGFQSVIADFICDVGGLDVAKMGLFEMFGITKDKLIHGGDGELTTDEILALLRCDTDYLLTKRFTGDNYEIYLLEQQLLASLKTLAEGNLYEDSNHEELLEDAKLFLKYFKDFGKDWYTVLNNTVDENGNKLLDGRTKEAKAFKSFLDSLGNAGDILKYGAEGIEYIARLFADYSAGIDVLDSFARNYEGDELILKAVEKVRAMYNKEFAAWAKEGLGIVAEHGLEFALSKLGDVCPVIFVINRIEETIGVVGEITGLGAQAEALFKALKLNSLCCSSQSAYWEAMDKFKKLNPGDEGYEQATLDVKNCFELTKSQMVQMFKYMATASTGDKRAYYKYCERQASKMNMKDGVEPPALLSFEEFCALEG